MIKGALVDAALALGASELCDATSTSTAVESAAGSRDSDIKRPRRAGADEVSDDDAARASSISSSIRIKEERHQTTQNKVETPKNTEISIYHQVTSAHR